MFPQDMGEAKNNYMLNSSDISCAVTNRSANALQILNMLLLYLLISCNHFFPLHVYSLTHTVFRENFQKVQIRNSSHPSVWDEFELFT